MIAVIVPAHNEEEFIGACVGSLQLASRCPALRGEHVLVVVTLDDCSDDTQSIAESLGATTLAVGARNVGHARAVGAEHALRLGARWLAFTDADTQVAPDWLSTQLALNTDAVCGLITVSEWGPYGERMERHFAATYCHVDEHRHVHGANLGVSAGAYVRAGGFRPLPTSEDVALVAALQRIGALIAWSSAPKVVTSARAKYRAPGGFGARLEQIERDRTWQGQMGEAARSVTAAQPLGLASPG